MKHVLSFSCLPIYYFPLREVGQGVGEFSGGIPVVYDNEKRIGRYLKR